MRKYDYSYSIRLQILVVLILTPLSNNDWISAGSMVDVSSITLLRGAISSAANLATTGA